MCAIPSTYKTRADSDLFRALDQRNARELLHTTSINHINYNPNIYKSLVVIFLEFCVHAH